MTLSQLKRQLKSRRTVLVLLICALLLCTRVWAQQTDNNQAGKLTLTEQIQQLKQEVIALNRDLSVLEDDLLFPSSTQLVVYLSMDVGDYFDLDSVDLEIDEQSVSHYLYSEKQQTALVKGGVQKLYLGNLAQGEHVISAFFVGTGPHKREYKQASSFTFVKSANAKMLELQIVDSSATQQPEFKVIEL